jgi:hypothetical protein
MELALLKAECARVANFLSDSAAARLMESYNERIFFSIRLSKTDLFVKLDFIREVMITGFEYSNLILFDN